jgi:prepilin-type processing-associated H-X9-DG protein
MLAVGRVSAQERQLRRSESDSPPTARAEKQAPNQPGSAEQARSFQELRAETAIHAIRIDRAQRALQRHDVLRAEEILSDEIGLFEQSWETRYVRDLCRRTAMALRLPTPVSTVAVSADGQRIALFSGWDVTVGDGLTGQQMLTLKGYRPAGGREHPDFGGCLAISADGRTILSSPAMTKDYVNDELKVWDGTTGEHKFSLSHCVHQVALSADGKSIVSVGGNLGKVWDGTSGKEKFILQGPCSCAAISADGRYLAWAMGGTEVKIGDAQTGEVKRTLKGHDVRVSSVAISADGRCIVSAGRKKVESAQNPFDPRAQLADEATVWDGETGQEKCTLRGVTGVALSGDGKTLVSMAHPFSDQRGEVTVWDTQTGQQKLSLEGHNGGVYGVAVSADGGRIVSWSEDRTVRVWNVKAGPEKLTLKGHGDAVLSVAVSADGERIVSGSAVEVKVWDAQAGRAKLSLTGVQGFPAQLRTVVLSADGQRIISGSGHPWFAGEVNVWDAATGASKHSLINRELAVFSVTASADGRSIVVGEGKVGPAADHMLRQGKMPGFGEIVVWDEATGRAKLSFGDNCAQAFNSLAMSADGELIVSACVDGPVKVWDARTGRERLTLPGKVAASVALSPDGRRIITAEDKTLKVWEARTGRNELTLKGHTGAVTSVAVSTDGERIVSGSTDKTVKVWDAQTGQEVLTLEGHALAVTSVAMSRNGQRIVSGSFDTTVKVWDAPPTDSGKVVGDWLKMIGSLRTVLVKAMATPSPTRTGVSTSQRQSQDNTGAYPGLASARIQVSTSQRQSQGNTGVSTSQRQSQENLKALAIAMHAYHDEFLCFPPAVVTSKDVKPLYSWRVVLLPFLEEEKLYRLFKLDEPWDSPDNKPLLARMPKVFATPAAAKADATTTHYQVLVGGRALFEPNRGVHRSRIRVTDVTDGLSNTMMIVEAAEPVPWSKPADLIYNPEGPLPKFGGVHPGGFNAAFADGSVYFIPSDRVPDRVLRAWITRNGGETVPRPEPAVAPTNKELLK